MPVIGRRDYAERRAARIERLEARAAKARAEGEARLSGARRIADGIPFGQPILVGHHSERRARKDAERIRNGYERGFERLKAADELERRAATAGSNEAISSDDPEAVVRLREKLAEEEAELVQIKAANAVLKKGGSVADAAALLTNQRDPVRHIEVWRSMGQRLLPTTNVSARIRATKKRLTILEARAAAPARSDEHIGGVTISESDNRVQIHFSGKPDEATRAALKRAGFRWAPSAGAWQRHASESAWQTARSLLSERV